MKHENLNEYWELPEIIPELNDIPNLSKVYGLNSNTEKEIFSELKGYTKMERMILKKYPEAKDEESLGEL
jgi:hypothetical protein